MTLLNNEGLWCFACRSEPRLILGCPREWLEKNYARKKREETGQRRRKKAWFCSIDTFYQHTSIVDIDEKDNMAFIKSGKREFHFAGKELPKRKQNCHHYCYCVCCFITITKTILSAFQGPLRANMAVWNGILWYSFLWSIFAFPWQLLASTSKSWFWKYTYLTSRLHQNFKWISKLTTKVISK